MFDLTANITKFLQITQIISFYGGKILWKDTECEQRNNVSKVRQPYFENY
jgi:hypothetical protein